jgi:hypothetical protein
MKFTATSPIVNLGQVFLCVIKTFHKLGSDDRVADEMETVLKEAVFGIIDVIFSYLLGENGNHKERLDIWSSFEVNTF